MILSDLLRERSPAIVADWIERTLGLFPTESSAFMRRSRDPFANPVGTTITAALEALFPALLEGAPEHELVPHLERIVQVTCIQGKPPSIAVGFVFGLKDAVRSALSAELAGGRLADELRRFDQRVDDLALLGFDSYARLRERIASIREREHKTRVSTLLKMARVEWDELPTFEQARDDSEARDPHQACEHGQACQNSQTRKSSRTRKSSQTRKNNGEGSGSCESRCP